MKRKAIAIAVVGALGAPALAYAQASTVQIYGQVRLEYSYIDEGAGLLKYDRMRNPGSSYIGFRGTERLGRGLDAWFQLESNFPGDGAGQSNPGTWGDRNTAVGLKGAFGNLFVGLWDTAYKRSNADTGFRVFDTTGVTGVGSILYNESTGNANNGTLGGGNATAFYRRQQNSVNYHSPKWGGFQVMFSFSSNEERQGLASGAGASSPRLWSLGATYING
ncbi:MAG: porin, partial [Betaproteobacteria bacterium]|nr:porin [Betaproteobacteria bacterium]